MGGILILSPRRLTQRFNNMILYKYCDLRGMDILKSCRLKATPIAYFNDPMEWSFQANSEEDRRDGELDYFRQPQGHQYFLESFDSLLGVICFSKVPDSLLMWSHYSDNHNGLVFGFDTDKFPEILRHTLSPVQYSRNKVKWNRNWEQDKKDEGAYNLCLTKSIDWSYEKEWRTIVSLEDCSKKEVGMWKKRSLYFVPIPAQSIVRVIMGARCDPKKVLKKLMWHGLKLENRVPFERAKPDSKKYQLNFSNIIDPRPESIQKNLTKASTRRQEARRR